MTNSESTKRFYELIWPHRTAILRVAHILSGNADQADDLAQETLLKAFQASEGFRAGTNAKAWLLTILRNTRTDRLRRIAGLPPHIHLDDLPTEPASAEANDDPGLSTWRNPGELLERFSDVQVIDALQMLSEDLRWTLLLVDVEQLDHSQAAQILGVPIGTVKSRVHRGRAMLRQALLPLARDWRLVPD